MDQEQFQEINTNLRSSRIDFRKKALDKLVTFDSTEAIPILKELAKEKDFGLRCWAMMGLRAYQTTESFAFLNQVLEQEQDTSVLAEAANSIFEFGDEAIAPLQDLFDRCDYWLVRHTIVSVLVESEDPQVLLQIATKAIADSEQTTKEIGILALNRLLNTELKEEALSIFTELVTAEHWRTRWRTAIALSKSTEPQAKKLLAQLRKDENYRVVAAALEQNT